MHDLVDGVGGVMVLEILLRLNLRHFRAALGVQLLEALVELLPVRLAAFCR